MTSTTLNLAEEYLHLQRVSDVIQTYEDGFAVDDGPYVLCLDWSGPVDTPLAERRLEILIDDSDLFAWGCATTTWVADPDPLRQCYEDCKATDAETGAIYAPYLYCARVRGLRPQGACYPHDRRFWPLFDACGPEREIDSGNPYPPGEYNPGTRDYFGRPPGETKKQRKAHRRAEILATRIAQVTQPLSQPIFNKKGDRVALATTCLYSTGNPVMVEFGWDHRGCLYASDGGRSISELCNHGWEMPESKRNAVLTEGLKTCGFLPSATVKNGTIMVPIQKTPDEEIPDDKALPGALMTISNAAIAIVSWVFATRPPEAGKRSVQ